MAVARTAGARSTAAAAAGSDHQRAMALALVGRSLERRTALEQRVKKLDPDDRADARLKVDKELKRDPGGVVAARSRRRQEEGDVGVDSEDASSNRRRHRPRYHRDSEGLRP